MQSDFKTVKIFKNGGIYKEHISIDKTKPDYKMIKNTGIEFARLGKNVNALPVVHFKSAEYAKIYGALEKTKYYRKCPDLLIDDLFYEVENYIPPFAKKKVNRMIGNGLKQSSNIIINNTNGVSDRHIRRLIYDHDHIGTEINEVWIYEKGKIRRFFKKQ